MNVSHKRSTQAVSTTTSSSPAWLPSKFIAPAGYQRTAASIAAACVIGLGLGAGAVAAAPSAQALPAGISVEDARAAISAPISVPAGQTTTVNVPIAVDAGYSGDGWSVSSAGNSVTITAPPEGGQISVPVSAQGQSATITLVAEGQSNSPSNSGGGEGSGAGGSGATGGDTGGGAAGSGAAGGGAAGDGSGGTGGDDAGNGGAGGAENGQAGRGGEGNAGTANSGSSDNTRTDNSSLPVVPGDKPERQAAEELDESTAERIDLESTIDGNTITAQLGLRQALDFYQRFGNLDQEQFTLRYVDADGNIIEDVERDIDATARTLTLTYPEGQAPDNPFYMQLVRKDGSGVEVIVSLKDPNFQAAGSDSEDATATSGESAENGSNLLVTGVVILGVLILLIIVGFVIRKIIKRRSNSHV
ncbi:hypothetical protein [Corynebacterium ammoniagenes]|uniref:Uncharacterized protein n=1 Tax=Corynebacterium ammoniagenes TaxID=1697 RepID=A0AAV5G8D0_CORAM|nr:hypothetical protein [Corynebacterium ammoniagenes]GJN42560.1 hypothetical protein CAT723_10390 [Corynebacterium ammoniagenes]